MGQSISERAGENDGEADPDAGELFPMGQVDGGSKTLKTLIPAGATVKSTISLASAEVPGAGALFDAEVEGYLLVSFQLGKVEEIPLRAEGAVQSWKVRQTLQPTFVKRIEASTAGELEAGFEQLLAKDAGAAAKLLDKLGASASKVLATA